MEFIEYSFSHFPLHFFVCELSILCTYKFQFFRIEIVIDFKGSVFILFFLFFWYFPFFLLHFDFIDANLTCFFFVRIKLTCTNYYRKDDSNFILWFNKIAIPMKLVNTFSKLFSIMRPNVYVHEDELNHRLNEWNSLERRKKNCLYLSVHITRYIFSNS